MATFAPSSTFLVTAITGSPPATRALIYLTNHGTAAIRPEDAEVVLGPIDPTQ
jgi:hypothetical protein